MLGTPAYMAPEQIRTEPEVLGTNGDVYSLGVMLYELLTGQLPFQGSSLQVLGKIQSQEPRTPSEIRADLAPALEGVALAVGLTGRRGARAASVEPSTRKLGSTSVPLGKLLSINPASQTPALGLLAICDAMARPSSSAPTIMVALKNSPLAHIR